MRCRLALRAVTALVLVAGAAGLHAAPPAASQPGDTSPGTYVVVFADQGLPAAESRVRARGLVAEHGGVIEHQYGRSLDGFAAELSRDQVRAIAADPRVDRVEPTYRVHIQDVDDDPDNWGDDRIDQRDLPLSDAFEYPDGAGQGAHIYLLDTGITAAHTEFAGRVGAGTDVIGNDASPDDCNGHGTHVAGTAAGTRYGVAKLATIHAVRIFDCAGEGTTDDIIAGLDWVLANAVRPAVVNMSLACDEPCIDSAVDAAVSSLLTSGIPVVQAAGNLGADACPILNSQAPGVITVGASTITDRMAYFSNYGSCVDIFAPGTDILSAAYSSTGGVESFSGTSMATPHVTGAAALYLAQHPAASSAEVRSALLANATVGRLTGLDASSPNRLLYMGFLLPPDPVTPPSGCAPRTAGRDVRIRDRRTTTSPLALTCAGSASARSRVTVRLAHTAIGDLKVTLLAPDGSSYLVRPRSGGATNNLNRTFVLDLSREKLTGTWRLLVTDTRRLNHGKLKSWTLDA